MKKGASYSLVAMGILLVASLGLGVYAKLSRAVLNVNADSQIAGLPQYENPCRVQTVPLKSGNNIFSNEGNSFSLEDQVVLIDGQLISFVDAQKKNIIGAVKNLTKKMDLQAGVLGVAIGDDFSLEVLDSSSSPALCLKGLK